MEGISFLPHFIEVSTGIYLSQTLIASLIGTALFLLLVAVYFLLKKKNKDSSFVHVVDMAVEGMIEFYQEIAGHGVKRGIVITVVGIFFYILRSNIIGLVGDLFATVVPTLHENFRPVSTDLFFNLTLAGTFVLFSIGYGFYQHGFNYIEKYIPYKGLGIVSSRKNPFKIFDVIIWLLIWAIELVGEVAKSLSLSLRLFWNILAGMVLLGLIVAAAQSLLHVPLILPLLVVVYELLVAGIQAFVFSMLVLLYFKVAAEAHH